MDSDAKKSAGRPKSEQSHQAMLQAALALLADVGFEAISMDAVAARARVGKTTIYRRYASKAELVADAIESMRTEIAIPDTGSFVGDLEALIQQAAEMTLSPLGRQAVAMIISSALSNSQFAEIYWTKYLLPRRQNFAIVVERAKARDEVAAELEADLLFDLISGIMLYATIQPSTVAWTDSVRRALSLVFPTLNS